MKKKTLYILLESQVRELHSLILLAVCAAKKGFRVYIGDSFSILEIIKRKKSFGGAYITKGSSTIELSKIIKKKCDLNIILDQEISPGYSEKYYDYCINGRQYKGSLKYVDRFYCVNKIIENRAKKILKKPNKNFKVISTGWPSFDLCKLEFNNLFSRKANELKKKYKNFILFNSDFGLVSEKNVKDFEETPVFTDFKKSFVKLNQKIRNNFKNHSIKDFKKVKLFFREIAKHNNIPNIVIRPHPSEDIKSWNEIKKYSKNFFIEKPNYDVLSAILASNFVLHRGSTTGYHALAFNKNTAYLNLLNENNSIEHFRPTLLKFSQNIKSVNDFKDWISKKKLRTKTNKKLYELLNLDLKYSVEKIIDDIDKIDIKKENNHEAFKLYSSKKIFFLNLKNFIYDILVLFKIKKERNYHLKNRSKKINKQFNIKYISKCVEIINKNLKSDIKTNLETKKVTENLFEIQKHDN